jgi:hypothetical protein
MEKKVLIKVEMRESKKARVFTQEKGINLRDKSENRSLNSTQAVSLHIINPISVAGFFFGRSLRLI